MKKIAYTVFALTCLLAHSAIAAITPCGNNCQLNYTTAQDVADVVNDFLGHNQNQATVTRDDETGVFYRNPARWRLIERCRARVNDPQSEHGTAKTNDTHHGWRFAFAYAIRIKVAVEKCFSSRSGGHRCDVARAMEKYGMAQESLRNRITGRRAHVPGAGNADQRGAAC